MVDILRANSLRSGRENPYGFRFLHALLSKRHASISMVSTHLIPAFGGILAALPVNSS